MEWDMKLIEHHEGMNFEQLVLRKERERERMREIHRAGVRIDSVLRRLVVIDFDVDGLLALGVACEGVLSHNPSAPCSFFLRVPRENDGDFIARSRYTHHGWRRHLRSRWRLGVVRWMGRLCD